MSEKKVRKRKKTEEEKRIEAEKFVYEKAKEAEQIEEKKEEKVEPVESMIKKESRTLRNIFLVLGLIIVITGFIFILNNASKNFTVDGVQYKVIQQGQLTLYNTWIPVAYNGSIRQYNFYLYSDPRVIQRDVPFNGTLNVPLHGTIILNMTGNLNCNGDGIIAVANFNTLYNLIGKVIKDSNATCDPSGQYVFINIQDSNETSIQEVGPACYTINVNNCQIMSATDRFMTQTFALIHNVSK